MPSALLTSKKNKAPINQYEFAYKCPDPCICDPSSPSNSEVNRPLIDEEKTIHFMVSNIANLNDAAQTLLIRKLWSYCMGRKFTEINRVKHTSRYFGIKKYRIRYAGSHGVKTQAIYFISDENDENHSISLAKRDVRCPTCGALGTTFRVTSLSKKTQCGKCLDLPEVSKQPL